MSRPKKRVLLVAGTRPEVIKLAPVVHELRRREHFEPLLGVSAQHRELLDQALAAFELEPDFDLDLMQPDQDLFELTAGVLGALQDPLREIAPDALLVQGDTTTAFVAALAGFYQHVPVGHVEAGLRSGTLAAPFPEEANRRLLAQLATWHFAPSARARAALLAEGVAPSSIVVSGNPVIDAVLWARQRGPGAELGHLALRPDARSLLVTIHRRESFGAPLREILGAVARLACDYPELDLVLPVHPNPNVAPVVREVLAGCANVHLTGALSYRAFVSLLARATLALSDSGGVQEEGPALGTPVLVLRDVTERPEAIEAGGARLVGVEGLAIERAARELLDDPARLAALSVPRFPYGEGRAAGAIAEALEAGLRS